MQNIRSKFAIIQYMAKREPLTNEQTAAVADLIKIKIPETELTHYAEMLNTSLDSAEVLAELDTESVEPTSQTHGLKNVLREDIPQPGLDMRNYKNTRNFQHGYFVVKKVL